MSTDWNEKKFHFSGQILSWDKKDDFQRLLTIVQNDVVDALNTTLEYGFVLEFTANHQAFINKSPHFWAEVMKSLRFTLIMKTARLFDESKGAIGLRKIFNIFEQSPYRETLENYLENYRNQYNSYHDYIDEIRMLRDKIYAHNDKKEYQFWKYPSDKDIEFEGAFWGNLEEMLIWARDSLLRMRTIIGDEYPVNIEITNDVGNILTFLPEDGQ
ncbi:hypothetical protein SAMN04487884_1574 [Butyrivibrio fibrisolvens]|uniref:HEPN AbiU2-like domain-containing protein n=1 Tax=Butyrivibrio fibrisolvens TaxID=831 RepID=A0A1H9XCG1_BUTFI|nr:hypothetical protein [Butyrivibrio fibrisolvens]SES43815.1 hypothetical protein SAMN04487884_1574 [Butyrivibrio fibrisolvens]